VGRSVPGWRHGFLAGRGGDAEVHCAAADQGTGGGTGAPAEMMLAPHCVPDGPLMVLGVVPQFERDHKVRHLGLGVSSESVTFDRKSPLAAAVRQTTRWALADLWLFVTPTKRRAVCAQPHLRVTAAQAILKNLGWRFCSMAKLVFGLNQSLDAWSLALSSLHRASARPGRQRVRSPHEVVPVV
jgi:hypothetical protein